MSKLQEIWDFFVGKKTFLAGIAIVTVTVLFAFNLIDDRTFTILTGLFGSGGLMALRNGQTTEADRLVVAAKGETRKIMASSSIDAATVVEAIEDSEQVS